MNPAFKDHVLSILRSVDVFLPSEQEVQLLLGGDSLWNAACCFAEAGPAVVVIKAGSKGSLVYDYHARTRHHIPPYPVDIVDVTGAGDAYCGGFMVGYQESGDPVVAACYGAVSASFVLEGFGALYALRFSRHQAEARLSYLRERAVRR
jgi:ribokinase